jgi:sugar/nucleoside kinase (ribokinase family)
LATIGCFSYLAGVHTLHVETYPSINYGVEVIATDQFIAGDGPLVAGLLAALGHDVTLASNQVADDALGTQLNERLRRWGVHRTTGRLVLDHTPVNIVACDAAGNRTWFSGLRTITAALDGAALGPTDVTYVDCYEVLGDAPRTVVAAALDRGSELVLNLGGSPPPPWLGSTLAGRKAAVLQTNADETDETAAHRQLAVLHALQVADLTVVTAGRRGAVAASLATGVVEAPAITVTVRQVQGAGAAFSAALIHSRTRGDDLVSSLNYACAAGSLWCTRSLDEPLPRNDEISALMRS